MLFNQFPVFTGVIGIGMLGASLFAQLGRMKFIEKKYIRVLFSALGFFAFVLIAKLLKYQTKQEVFRISQLKLRLPISILAVCVIIFFGLGINLPLRKILGFLSKISFNLYLWHQMLTVWIKYTLRIPKWYGDTPPNIDGNSVWMHKFNLIAWTVSLIVALAVTFFFEKPIKRILENKLIKKTTK
jgi:peptidoglycan/LPS O-acetylase OafA/YrhL